MKYRDKGDPWGCLPSVLGVIASLIGYGIAQMVVA